jgi:hypothetical protein
MTLALSVVLALAGIILLALGVWDAAKLVHGSEDKRVFGATDPASWADLVKASPRWLLLIIAGVALIVVSVVVAAQ